jgi:hypothetical protein
MTSHRGKETWALTGYSQHEALPLPPRLKDADPLESSIQTTMRTLEVRKLSGPEHRHHHTIHTPPPATKPPCQVHLYTELRDDALKRDAAPMVPPPPNPRIWLFTREPGMRVEKMGLDGASSRIVAPCERHRRHGRTSQPGFPPNPTFTTRTQLLPAPTATPAQIRRRDPKEFTYPKKRIPSKELT